ncbi:hypothetical protein [uncultured Nostoc sp.]|uniref:hypothetical protein n=1 Tax=uncultured Nostoc sp. TaxID=340711 RepID=UPI0035CB9C02
MPTVIIEPSRTLTGGIITAFYINKNYSTKILYELQEWDYHYNYAKSCIQLVNVYQKDDCIMVLFPFVEHTSS